MTRGKIIIIENDKLTSSCEFNGDMYISWYGKDIIKELKKINSRKEYISYVEDFNKNNFKYDENYFGIFDKKINNDTIDLSKNYFDIWFSDYLYFKNASNKDITIKCLSDYDKDNKQQTITTTIKVGETKVFNFGREIDYEKELKIELGQDIKDKDIFELYNTMNNQDIDLLYRISCIKASGVVYNNNTTLKLANMLESIWLKDENNTCLSWLSDRLIELYDNEEIDLDNETTREILLKIYL